MSEGRSVLLVGATGLVGGECLALLRRDRTVARVVTLTRRPLPPVEGPGSGRIENRVVDFDRLSDHADAMRVDQVICTLGTTIRKAGSRERFRQVDFGYPLEIARLTLAAGARHFLLVSAIGADSSSRFFYSRVKGELEEAIGELGFRSITIVRPSLLLGEREEFRLGERVAEKLKFLLPPRYRAVEASDVAAALVRAARADRPGRWVIESREIASGEY